MAISKMIVFLDSDIKTVWSIVTSLDNYSWRSDLSRIEVINDKQFVEYSKDGFVTTFSVTTIVPYKRWEFDMDNENIKGHWVGIFNEKDNGTEIEFSEDVSAKKVIMKPLVKSFIKKQQKLYIEDLKKELRL